MHEHAADEAPHHTAGRRPAPTLRRGLRAALAVAAASTLVTAVVHLWLAPPQGMVRTFYRTGDFDPGAAVEAPANDVGLAFLSQDPSLPRQSFAVQWRGFWHLREPLVATLHVNTNDEMELWVDSRPVLRRSPRDGLQTVTHRLPLAAGLHEIVIRYRQHGRQAGLTVLWSHPGQAPAPLPVLSMFARRVGSRDVAVARLLPWLTRAATLAWVASALLALAVGLFARGPGRAGLAVPTLPAFARRLSLVAGPALLPPVVLFVMGPHTIHAANPDEFVAPFHAIVWPWIAAAVAGGWACLVVAGALLSLVSERLTRLWASLLLVGGVLLWLQGTVLVPDYGPLFGERLDLSAHDGRAPYEAMLWGAALVGTVAYAVPISRVASLVSLLFVALQVGGIVAGAVMAGGGQAPAESGWSDPPPELYTLSRSRNVVHIVLDAFLSELFGEALRTEPAYFDRTFSGFVYFSDHLGAFPTTRASMPAMLAAAAYRNEEPFERFLGRTVLRRSVATVLSEHGFRVRSVTFHRREHPAVPGSPSAAVRYTVPTPYGTYDDYIRFTALQLFDFATFRHVPQALKRHVYNDDAWLWQRRIAGRSLQGQRARMVRPSNHAAFLTEMAGRLVADGDAPVYQFVHVALPHPPVVLDGDCAFVDRKPLSRAAYAGQSRCALRLVGGLLDRLRAIGVYDRSAIVVTADHGWRLPRAGHPLSGVATPAGDLQAVALTAMPLLAIKPMDASGPLRVSSAPTAVTDIPATIAALAGLPAGLFPGEPALQIDATARRSRSFAFHTWRDADWRREYMDALHVFSVDGPLHDPASWRFKETIADPAAGGQ